MIKGNVWKRVFGVEYKPPGLPIDQEPSGRDMRNSPPAGVQSFMNTPLYGPDGIPLPYQEYGGRRYYTPYRPQESATLPPTPVDPYPRGVESMFDPGDRLAAQQMADGVAPGGISVGQRARPTRPPNVTGAPVVVPIPPATQQQPVRSPSIRGPSVSVAIPPATTPPPANRYYSDGTRMTNPAVEGIDLGSGPAIKNPVAEKRRRRRRRK